jgi:hypothetical protein
VTPAFGLILFLFPPAQPGQPMMVPPTSPPNEQRQMVPPVLPPDVIRSAPTEPVIKLINVRGLKAKDLVKPLRTIYGHRPGFKIDVFKDANYLIVQGEQQVIDDILEIIKLLE